MEPTITDEKPKRRVGRPRKSDSAPKPTTQAKATKPTPERKPGRPSTAAKQKEQLVALIATIGTGVFTVNAADGIAILNGAESLADALVKVAEKNPAVARVLDGLLKTSTYGELVMAAAAIGIPIAANHGLLPPQVADVMQFGPASDNEPPKNGDEPPVADANPAA